MEPCFTGITKLCNQQIAMVGKYFSHKNNTVRLFCPNKSTQPCSFHRSYSHPLSQQANVLQVILHYHLPVVHTVLTYLLPQPDIVHSSKIISLLHSLTILVSVANHPFDKINCICFLFRLSFLLPFLVSPWPSKGNNASRGQC